MAIKFAKSGDFFQGLSSDVKPTGVSNGAKFRYIDTGEQYVFHDKMWELDLSDPVTRQIHSDIVL